MDEVQEIVYHGPRELYGETVLGVPVLARSGEPLRLPAAVIAHLREAEPDHWHWLGEREECHQAADRAMTQAYARLRDLAQRARVRRWAARVRVKMGLESLGPGDQPLPGSKILSAWIQYTGAQHVVFDVVAGGWQQHIDAKPNEVLLLPTEVAKLLLALPDSPWIVQTVIPDTLSAVHDGATGLDKIFVVGPNVWGLHPSGQPYFEPDFGADPEEAMRLLVRSGKPYLSND